SKQAADTTGTSGRLDSLAAKEMADATSMTGRLDSVVAKQGADAATLGGRLDTLDGRIAAVDQQAKQTASQIGTVAERSGRVVRMQAAIAALESGQPLGAIPDAPPAVSRFATTPAKTEVELRRSFDAAAEAAEQAGQPAIMESRSFGERLVARAQQAVTVRQGDRVLVGDPLSGRIIRARAALDAGDLAGAVKALDGLAGPAQAAMADWVGQARALLDARTALSSMAAHS
ncbi:MAG: mitofilin family membrane protein, partial [Janthinobacterium lividum]